MIILIKLIAIDLDGTLLDNDKHIRDIDRKAVKDAIKNGIMVTIFTGRNYHSAKKYVEELDVKLPVVFQNGAFIMDFNDKSVLNAVFLDGTLAKNIVRRARKENLFYIVYTDFLSEKDMYVDREYNGPYRYYLENNFKRIVKVEDVLEYINERIAQLALIGEENKILKIVNELDVSVSSVIKSTTIENHSFYEVFGPGCSKAKALDFLLEKFKVSKEEVMFIGDGYNDLEIMKTVGKAVAMGNAPEDVKKVAHYITETNENGGVAKAIYEFVLKDRS